MVESSDDPFAIFAPRKSEPAEDGPDDRNSDLGIPGAFDGGSVEGAIDPTNVKRKRGRPAKPRDPDAPEPKPAGSRSSKEKEDVVLALENLSDILIMLHAGLAGSMNAPEMILTKDEAETLARSTRNVLRHYSFGSVSQVRKDWFMLAVCLGGLYLPRFRKMAARAATKTEEELPQNVYPLKSS